MKNYGLILWVSLFALLQSSVLSATENPLLKSVPADTVFFSGNTQLINLKDYPVITFKQSFDVALSQKERNELGKELAFFYELFLDFKTIVHQGSTALQKHYGLSENIAVAIYTQGITPVLKLTVENEQAFLDVFNKAEQKTGFQHRIEHFADLKYRSYPIGEKHHLIVYMQTLEDGKKQATLSILSSTLADKQKKLIFGLIKPEPSIADTDKLKSMQKKNSYLPLSVSFVDFQALVKSIFQEKNNAWSELFGDEQHVIADLQASGCEADVMAIAGEMPQIIAGYKQYQVQGQQVKIEFETLLEIKNQNVKAELNKFRGFIPDYVRNGTTDNIIAIGFGANLSQLSPLFFYLSKAIRESSFQCEQFKKMQQDAAKFNPGMVALMTGMVDGVQGISFALQKFDLTHEKADRQAKAVKDSQENGENVKSKSVSFLLSLSAENPLRIWQMLTAISPEITAQGALIIPAEKPQKLKLAELERYGIDLFVALKGKHLVLYSGDKAEAISNKLKDEPIVNNGFFQESLNYTKLATAVENLRHYMTSDTSPQILAPQACIYFDESIAVLSKFSGFLDFRSDFTSSGWLSALKADVEFTEQAETDFQLAGKYETYYVQDGCKLTKDGLEEINKDGTGFYQQYSGDEKCFIYETRYRWSQNTEQFNLQYLSERRRAEGVCANAFESWSIPEADYVNDSCQLRKVSANDFSCLFKWGDVLKKAVYQRL